MPLSPLILLLTLLALTAAAAATARIIELRRRKTLHLTANRLDWHYTHTDRFQLCTRLRNSPPIISPADLTVSHVAHRQVGQTLHYVACLEFTIGALHRPRRRRLLAEITESPTQTTITYHPCPKLVTSFQALLQ